MRLRQEYTCAGCGDIVYVTVEKLDYYQWQLFDIEGEAVWFCSHCEPGEDDDR